MKGQINSIFPGAINDLPREEEKSVRASQIRIDIQSQGKCAQLTLKPEGKSGLGTVLLGEQKRKAKWRNHECSRASVHLKVNIDGKWHNMTKRQRERHSESE